MKFAHPLKKLVFAAALTLVAVPGALAENWIVKDAASSVSTTADQLVGAVEKAGATLFARVDHAAGAKSIDAELSPMTMVMFGNPRLGTPILQAAPRAGIDLPIRVLIWEEDGVTKIGYLDPAALKARYGVEGADAAFDMMTGALDKLTTAAAQ
ncbi:MAG: DUF302 domain-containing protein [Ahrensia sp.]